MSDEIGTLRTALSEARAALEEAKKHEDELLAVLGPDGGGDLGTLGVGVDHGNIRSKDFDSLIVQILDN